MNFQNVCRVCIREDVETKSIFEFYNFHDSYMEITEVITNCASVQIHKLDGFSTKICKNCLDDLCHAYHFKKTCEESDYKFRNNLIYNNKIIISSMLPIIQYKCDEIIERNEIPTASDNELPDSKTDITTLEILNGALPESLQNTAPPISDMFSEEDIKIECSESKIKEENEDVYTLMAFGLSEIKAESPEEEPQIKCGVLENLLEEENVTKSTTEITKLQNFDDALPRTLQKYDSNEKLFKCASHTGDKTYKCDTCGKCFKQKGQLKTHKRIHTGDEPYKCEICGKCFNYRVLLNYHMNIHTGDNPYKCDTCGKCFKQRGHLSIHKRIHTGEKPYKCATCDKSFNQRVLLNYHMNIHTGDKPYKCDNCGKCYKQSGQLSIHKRIHTGEKPYKCVTCGKCFNERVLLNYHMNIHTGDKPYKCELCSKRFILKGDLNVHIRIHTGEKPYECEICGKCFNQKGNLSKHNRIHTGEKPYECEICGKCFNRNGSLSNHKKFHTGVKPYKCETCDNSFYIKGQLNRHKKVNTKCGARREFHEEEAQIQYEETSSIETILKTEPAIIDRIAEEDISKFHEEVQIQHFHLYEENSSMERLLKTEPAITDRIAKEEITS